MPISLLPLGLPLVWLPAEAASLKLAGLHWHRIVPLM